VKVEDMMSHLFPLLKQTDGIPGAEGSSSSSSPLHTALSNAMLKYGGMLVVSGDPR